MAAQLKVVAAGLESVSTDRQKALEAALAQIDRAFGKGSAMKGVDVPTAIIGAERDELIPPARTNALRPKVPRLVFDETIAGAGHNDIYVRKAFHEAMHEAFDKVLASK